MKKMIVAGLYVLCCFAFGVVAIEEANAGIPMMTLMGLSLYSGGSGTEADPYLLASKADLLELSVNTADYDKYFVMTNDIDLTGEIFTTAVIAADTNSTPFNGFMGTKFSGVFNGGGFKIENLTIDTAGVDNDYLGLFGYISGSGAEIVNLGVESLTITGGEDSRYIGGLCGYNSAGSISGGYLAGTVSGGESAGGIGGLCGVNEEGKINESWASCAVNGAFMLGGLCGQNIGGSISNCYSTGSVSGSGDSEYFGGLCGLNEVGAINNCYANGDVSAGEGFCLGGLCGGNIESLMMNSYSTGTVRGDEVVGGLCGENGDGIIRGCYSTGAVSGSYYIGGLCGEVNDSIVSNCYSTGFVSGDETVGGLCGSIGGSTIFCCYSVGLVNRGNDFFGGLFGEYGMNNISACYHYLWSGPFNGAGVIMTAEELQSSGSYVCFDFAGNTADGANDIWTMVSGHMPKLSWQSDDGPLPPAYGAPSTTLQGDGDNTSPFLINALADFQEFYSNADLDRGYYQLNTDVDLTGISFTNAVVDRQFGGFFDGNGHDVKNMTIDTQGKFVRCMGLFSVNSGSINHLGVENISIDGGLQSYYIGGLCAMNDYGSISECYTTGSISGGDYIGGLSGRNSEGLIRECYSSVSINGSSVFGGLGGLCGQNYKGAISKCYSTGVVSGSSGSGGLCGSMYGATFENSFWDTQTSGMSTSAGGTGKTTAEMQTQSTFTGAGWDFVGEIANGTNSIWYMDGYPQLRCFAARSMLSFGKWALVEGIPIGMRGENDCPAGDGISNLMKYACGLPAMQEGSLKDIMTIVKAAEDVFSVRYVKSRKTADSIYIQPVWSTLLSGPWTSSNMTDVLVSEGEMQEERMASIPLGTRGFLRLLVFRIVVP